jgi:hypothetical protein
MKNPIEVLRSKEQDLLRVKEEIEALRVAARLLGDETESNGDGSEDLRQAVKMP